MSAFQDIFLMAFVSLHFAMPLCADKSFPEEKKREEVLCACYASHTTISRLKTH